MIICISGTPGTGKTYFAKKLAKSLKFRYFDLNAFIKENKLYESYDKKAKTYDVDMKKIKKFLSILLNKYLYNEIDGEQKRLFRIFSSKQKFENINKTMAALKSKKNNNINNIIIDSHMSHCIDADFYFIVNTEIKKLATRLKRRGYSQSKITENVQSEIFDICFNEAKDLKRKIIRIAN